MTTQPEVVDNLNQTHREALEWIAQHRDVPLATATGYVNLDGLNALAHIANGASPRPTRLLIGATPNQNELTGGPGETVRDRFEQSVEALRRERNWNAFPPNRRATLEEVSCFLSNAQTEVRRYTAKFLHGKAYLFGRLTDGKLDGDGAALVTSANLTRAGMDYNLELGIAHYQPTAVSGTLQWYDHLWENAQDYKAELQELLLPAITDYDPQTIFLRVLLELFGLPTVIVEPPPTASILTDFQQDGYHRAKEILQEHHGVLYADGVGMGKTEIGLQFLRDNYWQLGQRTLVIAPAQLRDDLWTRRLAEANLPGEVVSYQQLAGDPQLGGNGNRVLAVGKDAYRLIIIDEAHNYRNRDNTWYAALERLLSGPRKQLVLLTATPVNNTLWDLRNMIMLFTQQRDSAFTRSLNIRSLREYFKAAINNEESEQAGSDGNLFTLLNAVTVRRDRSFVMQHYPNSTFQDGTPVRFPTPELRETRYELSASGGEYDGIASYIAEKINELTMARYQPSAYLMTGTEASHEKAIAGLMQSQLLKRFESSWFAALLTTERMATDIEALLAAMAGGYIPPGQELRSLSAELDDGIINGDTLEDLMDAWGDQARPTSDFRHTFEDDLRKDQDLLVAMATRLRKLHGVADPKLARFRDIMTSTESEKVAIFTTYADTADYLELNVQTDPSLVGNRDYSVVVGGRSSPRERVRQVERFCPGSEVENDIAIPHSSRPRREDEIDALISTDVMSEGQNLQQAQAVVSFDMPWNPQRVVQRNGRIIRLKSPHDTAYLYTLMPQQEDLEELLKLEAKLQAKIIAANNSIGMESPVLASVQTESRIYADLKGYTDRLSSGDTTILDDGNATASFIGERYRAELRRHITEEGSNFLNRLPWGIGSAFVSTSPALREPAVFFACRTRQDESYWRIISASGELVKAQQQQMLHLIDPSQATRRDIPEHLDLQKLFDIAADDIVAVHNQAANVPPGDRLTPVQRWAISTLRQSPDFPGRQAALGTLQAAQGKTFLSELRAIRQDRGNNNEGRNTEYGQRIAELAQLYGPSDSPPEVQTKNISKADLGVVCYQVILNHSLDA